MTLAERERGFVASMPPSDQAKRLAPKLREIAADLRREASVSTGAKAEMRELDAERIESAAELLRILEQEQWRQREAAKLFLQGQIERADLRRYSETWNEARAVQQQGGGDA